MEHPIAVITGASSGMGAHLTTLLAEKGWNLILINRSRAKTQALVQHIHATSPQTQVEIVEADLADQDAVREAAELIARHHDRLDALFNNAGVLLGELAFSRHDNELHFQVNTLAPYMLMRLLHAPLAQAGHATILNVSSSAIEITGSFRIDELRHPPALRKLVGAYAQSKLAVTTLTQALAPAYQQDGIILRSMDPGGTKTSMTGGNGMPGPLLVIRNLAFQSPEKGAQTIYEAALSPHFGAQTGIYISGKKIKQPPKDARDPEVQQKLLALCRELTQV